MMRNDPSEIPTDLELMDIDLSQLVDQDDDGQACKCGDDVVCIPCLEVMKTNEYERGFQDGMSSAGTYFHDG